MSDAPKSFDFSQFVPGFDFLKNLSAASMPGNGTGAVPGMPSLSSWVAPTLSVEEVDKRIQELKTVQYWLEQNGHALKATIQALEVQKMTLSTLRGMNVRMEDIAQAFTRQAKPAAPETEGRPEPAKAAAAEPTETPAGADADSPGVVDPLQWWGALTQQFQQIASTALKDAAELKMPPMAQPLSEAVSKAMKAAMPQPPAAKKAKAPARKKTPATRKTAPARKRPRPPKAG